jgi:solute carrier family 25 (mitochondrial carnitine/acylcarnitine transporter), member 20/29
VPLGALTCATNILRNEGPLAFYKGTLTPLLGIGACVSIQFGAFHFARRHLESLNPHKSGLTLPEYYLAGAFAGIANSPLSNPIENVRIRLQTQPHEASKRLFNGPLDCIKKLIAADGLRRGLFRAQTVTVLREIQAYGVWFLTFEYLMSLEKKRSETPKWKIALYGGLSGEALWLASYPFDVVKSRLQSDGLGANMKWKTGRECAKQLWREGGVGAFWKGLGPTLVRAMPVSAGTFFVVEMVLRAMG